MSNSLPTTTNVQVVDLKALAADVARYLPGWTLSSTETNEYHALLRHESGPELSLSVDHYRKRIHIRASWPSDRRNGSYRPYSGAPAISVGAARKPKAVAREIERRFLPAFMPLWHEAESRRLKAEESNAKAEALAQRLRDTFGLPRPEDTRYGMDRESVHVHAGGATFEVRRHGSVKIEVTTSREDAVLRLAEAIRALGLDDE